VNKQEKIRKLQQDNMAKFLGHTKPENLPTLDELPQPDLSDILKVAEYDRQSDQY